MDIRVVACQLNSLVLLFCEKYVRIQRLQTRVKRMEEHSSKQRSLNRARVQSAKIREKICFGVCVYLVSRANEMCKMRNSAENS